MRDLLRKSLTAQKTANILGATSLLKSNKWRLEDSFHLESGFNRIDHQNTTDNFFQNQFSSFEIAFFFHAKKKHPVDLINQHAVTPSAQIEVESLFSNFKELSSRITHRI